MVQNYATGDQHTFAAFRYALAAGIAPTDFLARLPELEARVLGEFNRFVLARPSAAWVYWGAHGLDVVAQRAAELGLAPVGVPAASRRDLANYLKLTYGDEYVPHPRLPNAIRLNLGEVPSVLDGEAAAAAWREGRYNALVMSAQAKVSSIARLLSRVYAGTFSVATVPKAVPDLAPPAGPAIVSVTPGADRLSEVEREILEALDGARGQFLSSDQIAARTPSRYQGPYIRRFMKGLKDRDLVRQGKARMYAITPTGCERLLHVAHVSHE